MNNMVKGMNTHPLMAHYKGWTDGRGGVGGGGGGQWEAECRLNPSIPDIDVTYDWVRNLLLISDLNKSAGYDSIHAAF